MRIPAMMTPQWRWVALLLASVLPGIAAAQRPRNNAPMDAPYRPVETPVPLNGAVPERPVQLLGSLEGKLHPVVRMNVTRPVLMVDRRTVDGDREPSFALLPGSTYHPAEITFIDVQLYHWDQGREGSRFKSRSRLEGWINCDIRLENAFVVAVVLDERDFLIETKEPVYGITAVELGAAEPGERKKFEIEFTGIAHQTRLRWLAGVFSNGIQARATNPLGSFSTLLDRGERFRHSRLVTERVKARKDAELLLYRPIAPSLPDDLRQRFVGKPATLDLAVSTTGTVTGVRLVNPDAPDLEPVLSAVLQHWLFLPRITGGKAVDGQQRVTISL